MLGSISQILIQVQQQYERILFQSEEDPQYEADLQSNSSWLVPIEVMLESLSHAEVQACSICRVSDELRAPKEEAYKPKSISIGPLHRGATRNLELMEGPKWHYVRVFLEQQGTTSAEDRNLDVRLSNCGRDILKMDEVIRASYGGNIFHSKLPQEVAKTMIFDGCFLLELLRRLGNKRLNYEDQIFETKEKVLSAVNDITMLENQIPFIVLKKLYRKVFPDGSEIEDDHRVANIVCKAFGYPPNNVSGSAHILHLMHLSTVDQSEDRTRKRSEKELFRCASRLRAAGIIIRPKTHQQQQLELPDIISNQQQPLELADTFNFDISFNDSGKLKIPVLYVKETTEVRWRNLIALEQSRINIRCKYTSYALFFKGLICCKHDIELLVEKGVIDLKGCDKSKEELLTLFSTISTGSERMDFSYTEICNRLNVYNGKKFMIVLRKLPLIGWHQCRRFFETVRNYCRHCFRIFVRDYLSNVWKIVGIVAAATLLVLTILQTIYSSRS